MEGIFKIKEIASALMKFRGKINKIKKDAKNPYFKSNYASLSNILSEIDPVLIECGLTFVQLPEDEFLTTILIHPESGEFITSKYRLHAIKDEPQQWGSAISYARRYALCSILGLNVDDDDGERAQKPFRNNGKQMDKPMKAITDQMFAQMSSKYLAGEMDIFKRAIDNKYGFTPDQLKIIDELKKEVV